MLMVENNTQVTPFSNMFPNPWAPCMLALLSLPNSDPGTLSSHCEGPRAQLPLTFHLSRLPLWPSVTLTVWVPWPGPWEFASEAGF